MQPYKNLSGTESISGYEVDGNYINVHFSVPSRSGYKSYKYSYESAGQENVEKMKELALKGEGLASFIEANVRKSYEHRWV